MQAPVKLGEAATSTDIGLRMTDNEDASVALPSVPLYAIADGSGALWPAGLTLRSLGEHASSLTEFQSRVANDGDTSSRLAVGHFFESVLNEAGRAVKDEMGRRAEGRATSTVVAMTLMGPYAYLAHVGDSRAYLFRDKKLRCLTTDHTLAMLQLKRGETTAEDYAKSPYKKTLTQAIGVTPELRPDIAEVRVAAGDLFLLCSDGLHRMVQDRRIAEILAAETSLAERAEALVQAAREGGGKDNVTVQLIPVESVGELGDKVEAKRERLDTARVLGKCFLFQKISESERLLVAPYFEYQAFEPGDIICREGDAGDSLYVVVAGKIRVTFQRAHLIDIGPGGWAGEIALVREGPRTATLTARDKVVLLVLSRARFLEILRRRPSLGAQLAQPLLEFVGKRVVDLRTRLRKISEVVAGASQVDGG
ncbi:MAG: cyclic nucleotide-binding domain-containing protein [Deltaproteobacteria bacterium]|nr:cyclic nucleotide-binding domain-containing protein [Deltaproteobacteria bacterium]